MSKGNVNQEEGMGQLKVIPCQPSIGAEITGVDLSSPLPASQFDVVYASLLKHKVIFFRDQHINADQQIAFGQQFGPLETNPFRPQGEGKPELQIIKNDKDNPVLSTDVWHADLTFRSKPTKFTILHCLEIPESGGDTIWSDMCAAYQGLSNSVQEFITGLTALHDFKNFRVLFKEDPAKSEELHKMEDMFPNPSHPVVITHPETHQRVLFVNRQFTLRIEGMSDEESRQILELLYDQSRVPEYQFRLKWQPGTVAIWDNRSCQHYAVNDYYPKRRYLERVAVAGDSVPYYNPDAKPDSNYTMIRRVHAVEGLH
jgi:taurine dioxygenase